MSSQLTRVSILGLFGHLDHDILFPSGDDFIILYGANGVGKTTVLRLINALYSANFDEFMEVPFKSVQMAFDNGAIMTVVAVESEPKQGLPRALLVALYRTPGAEPTFWNFKRSAEMSPRMREWLETETTWRRIERNLWQDVTDGEILPESDVVRLFGQQGVRTPERLPKQEPMPDAIRLFLNTLKASYISTDRLSVDKAARSERQRSTNRVNQYSLEIRRMITRSLTKDAHMSQELDRTFPIRLLKDTSAETPSEPEIRRKYDVQNKRRAGLRRIGLISGVAEIELPPGNIEEWKRRALALFLEDTDKRLSTFDEISPRLSLFHEMINDRFVGKAIHLTESGLEIEVRATGRRVQPALLSSGEQHELILTYDLVFNTSPGRLVLIDEPEISLHAVWQQQFLADMRRILKVTKSRAIIATHSPQIVDRWTDSMVHLKSGIPRA